MTKEKSNVGTNIARVLIYVLLITLTVLSILPFVIMFVNATRSTPEIQQSALSLIPSRFLANNYNIMMRGAFNPFLGFRNSFIVSAGAPTLAIYFSALTAYANVAYDWKFKNALFAFILFVMMIPAQVSAIGFFQFVFRLGWSNTFWPLILPAVASPAIVFFMRQYLLATLPSGIVEAARIDGSKEFFTFNRIIMPIMKPALATQAIFVFVGSWNNLFLPSMLLTRNEMRTMPVMVLLLRGDIYRTELGTIYLGLAMTVLPLFIVYFLLSKYIIAGVALGGVKE